MSSWYAHSFVEAPLVFSPCTLRPPALFRGGWGNWLGRGLVLQRKGFGSASPSEISFWSLIKAFLRSLYELRYKFNINYMNYELLSFINFLPALLVSGQKNKQCCYTRSKQSNWIIHLGYCKMEFWNNNELKQPKNKCTVYKRIHLLYIISLSLVS